MENRGMLGGVSWGAESPLGACLEEFGGREDVYGVIIGIGKEARKVDVCLPYLSPNGCDLLDHTPARLLLAHHFHCFSCYGKDTEEIHIHLLLYLSVG